MAETKDDIAAERDDLRARVAQLEAAAAASAAALPNAPVHRFVLSEGDRQELAARGAVNVAGRLRGRDDVRALLGDGQADVDLGDGPVDPGLAKLLTDQRERGDGAYGVDYVYPSVAPGKIDPALAGTPGVNGPSA